MGQALAHWQKAEKASRVPTISKNKNKISKKPYQFNDMSW
jgi:hypothetical protein